MKILVRVEEYAGNFIEFDGGNSELSQEEIVKIIHKISGEWVKRFKEEHANR